MPARVFQVKSGWLADQASRLDATAYGEGGLTARDLIRAGPLPWSPLGELAEPYLPPRFVRRYVRDPARGVPFLSSSDMLLADLSGLPLLSQRATPNLDALTGMPHSTLVSRSGTIGRTVYLREELRGMVVSDDVIHVRPRRERIRPGYLYAFLTSKPAQAMIRQQTYGSVVQHIEPHHLADLPVALPETTDQRRIHDLVEGAAAKRTEASQLLAEASGYFDARAGLLRYPHEHARAIGLVFRSRLRASRLDAFAHCGWASEGPRQGDQLGEIADVVIPGRRKLILAERGVEFLTGVDVYQLRPGSVKTIAAWLPDIESLRLTPGQILIQADGQRYGLLGRPALTGRRLAGKAASWHLARVSCSDPGRIFAFARSEIGRRAIVGTSYGTSVPAISQGWLRRVPVPRLPTHLADMANRALELREQADADEERAIQEVEAWLG